MQRGVFGFVNHAHSSATQFLEHAVMRDAASGKWLGICHGAAILGRAREQGKSRLDRVSLIPRSGTGSYDPIQPIPTITDGPTPPKNSAGVPPASYDPDPTNSSHH